MTRGPLLQIYQRLFEHFGPQHWWPAETPFEVMIGAILTQNTAWSNVEKAIANLRTADTLTPQTLADLPQTQLEQLIRPAGFFRQKASRLKTLARLLETEYRGEIADLCSGELEVARARLLAFNGIGPETADSILLYACTRPTFVVDAYTRRLFSRLGLLEEDASYTEIRAQFMSGLPGEVALFNEYHALIVAHCKRYCRKRRPDCAACPLCTGCPAAMTI